MTLGDGSEIDGHRSGSPKTGEPEFLAVGRLRKPHGVRGEMSMEVHTDFPERFNVGKVMFVGQDRQPFTIRSVRKHNQLLLIAFEGVEDREEAGVLRNRWVFVRTQDRPELPEGEYYHHQILGLAVQTTQGRDLGNVVEILMTGANDVLIVKDVTQREVLLPVTDEVITQVDLTEGVVIVRLLPGLLPE